ncbi:MAG: YggS family pyridoxal phosphate-dependent enzyme [Clostridia bacterium]|nr:YggS family pyridoxal phosphate-dependent enzyme [Clostridia bacterium]
MEKSSVDTDISGAFSGRFHDVEENLKSIRFSIGEAAIQSGRNPDDIILMAVTKTVPVEVINHALSLGVDYMGENRVQELNSKYESLSREGKHIHLIGHLQTNKVKQVVGKVEMIQSVDSARVARAIASRSEELGIVTNVLVEVNIGKEENKSGILPESAYELICEISEFDGINVQGLMAIPPADCEIAQTIRYFDEIYKLFIDIGSKNTHNNSYTMKHLSMGMSADYAEAIKHGSTMVRVGTALFGRRNYSK